MTTSERPTRDLGPVDGREPAEGRDDLDLPGADRADTPMYLPRAGRHGSDDPGTERRDELADRVRRGGPGAAGSIDSDLRPDVEIPEDQM